MRCPGALRFAGRARADLTGVLTGETFSRTALQLTPRHRNSDEHAIERAFKTLEAGDAAELAALLAIYREAIDPSEQKKPDEIAAMLGDPRYALITSHSGGRMSGFAMCFFPDAADFWLLEYMAVDASLRGQRLGEALFLESYRYGLARDPARAMVLEVDEPGRAVNPKNDTEARFRFYGRLGCRRLQGLEYILPMQTAGTPPPMLLLSYTLPPLASIPRARARAWLTTLYVDVYGMAADDPRIERMVSSLGDTIAVEALERGPIA